VDAGAARLRDRFREQAAARAGAVRDAFVRRGIDFLEVAAGADCAPVIEAFLKSRATRRVP
jgi:hypothetical protein